MKHMKCITAPYCPERRFCVTKYDMGCKRCKLGSLNGTRIPKFRVPEDSIFQRTFERELRNRVPGDFRPGRPVAEYRRPGPSAMNG